MVLYVYLLNFHRCKQSNYRDKLFRYKITKKTTHISPFAGDHISSKIICFLQNIIVSSNKLTLQGFQTPFEQNLSNYNHWVVLAQDIESKAQGP